MRYGYIKYVGAFTNFEPHQAVLKNIYEANI